MNGPSSSNNDNTQRTNIISSTFTCNNDETRNQRGYSINERREGSGRLNKSNTTNDYNRRDQKRYNNHSDFDTAVQNMRGDEHYYHYEYRKCHDRDVNRNSNDKIRISQDYHHNELLRRDAGPYDSSLPIDRDLNYSGDRTGREHRKESFNDDDSFYDNSNIMERGGYRATEGDKGRGDRNVSHRGRRDDQKFYRRRAEYQKYDRHYPPKDDDTKRRRLSDDGHHQRRHGSGSSRDHYRDDNRDRRHRRHSTGSGPSPPHRKQVEWPSLFEESGGNYVFDARSGLFYEALSNYFYDPKNKLYYSNEKKVYYRYCPQVNNKDQREENNAKERNREPDESKFWEEVKPEEGAMSAVATAIGDSNSNNKGADEGNGLSQDLVVQALQGSNTSSIGKNDKKKINICIKKKFTGSVDLKKKYRENQESTAAATSTATTTINSITEEKQSIAQKVHNANITKWASIRAEGMKADDSCHDDDTGKTNNASSRIIKVTKEGKPICFVCKRKFADIEKLKNHEELSSLHKQNVAKKRQFEEAKPLQYRDRANDRRNMYEGHSNVIVSTIDPSIVNMGISLEKVRTVAKTEKIAPEQTLGDSNVGNKLLQRLGWKSGESLGRRRAHEAIIVEGTGQSCSDIDDKLAKLKQDWERIEDLSGQH